MIIIQGGITIGAGIQMGNVAAYPTYIITEDGVDEIVTEDNRALIEE